MKRIKLNLGLKTVDQKVAQGNAIKAGLTGNPNFPTPNPSLPTFDDAIINLSAKKVARDTLIEAAKAATVELREAEQEYDLTASALAAYAEAAVLGDAAKLEGAGFAVRNPSLPIGSLPQVQDLRVTSNTYAGKLFVRWQRLHGVKTYEVQICTDALVEANWYR